MQQAPKISADEAKILLRECYGIQNVVSLAPLTSFDDQNYLVECRNDTKFVLKIHNAVESSAEYQHLTQQQLVCRNILRDNGFSCCATIPTVHGQHIGMYKSHSVELHTFLAGTQITECRDYTLLPQIFHDVGQLTARVRKVLRDKLPYEEFLEKSHRIIPFGSLARANDIKPLLDRLRCSLENDCDNNTDTDLLLKRYAMVERALGKFNVELLERKHNLPLNVIHGDINDANVMFSVTEEGKITITGLVDFMDCHVTHAVFDLALAMTYMMLLSYDTDGSVNPFTAARAVLAGYTSEYDQKLTDDELQILPTAMAMRVAQVLVISNYAYKFNQPENDYLLVLNEHGWTMLKQLLDEPDEILQ